MSGEDAAIAAALVTRLGALTPPTGQPALAQVTYQLPQAIGPTPAVLVFPAAETDLGHHPGGMLTSEMRWMVRFYIAPVGDIAASMDTVYAWRSMLRLMTEAHIELGLAYVTWARVTGITPGWLLPYADTTYLGLEMEVTVGLQLAPSPVA